MLKHLIFMVFPLLTACLPDVYLIDRQTILEIEASGEWQELDRKYQTEILSQGPIPLEETKDKVADRQIFSMTHADHEQPLESKDKAPASKP